MINRAIRFLYRPLQRFLFGGHRPNFIIIGAQKSGTTSLFSYLSENDGFLGSIPKEVHFFDREDRFRKGEMWYESHFVKPLGKVGLFFEASPTYLYRKKVPARLKSYDPNLKLIILLREPISRAYSAWNMYRQWSDEGKLPSAIARDQYGRVESPIYRAFFKNGCPSFSNCIKMEMELIAQDQTEDEPSLLRRGVYKPQIERYVELFGWSNILILGFNELRTDSEGVVRKCHEFLGLPYHAPRGGGETVIKNKRSYPSKISDKDFEILKLFYDQSNNDLFDYLGFRPDW